MNKLAFLIMTIIAGMFLSLAGAQSYSSEPGGDVPEVWVDDDFDSTTPGWGITHFNSIVSGVSAVDAHGTVHVHAGLYTQRVWVTKPLTLAGEDRGTTIIKSNYKQGIFIETDGVKVSGFTIRGKGIESSMKGIYVNTGFNDTVITNNRIIDNFYGMMIGGKNHTLADNIVEWNYYGIFINSDHQKARNEIRSNSVIWNKGVGIFVACTDWNTIVDNDIIFSGWGNYSPSDVVGISLNYDSRYNLIYHNNLIDNGGIYEIQAKDDGDNTWVDGYPSGGNYWHDYAGEDLNGDGIGDDPYLINGVGNNQDNYPLMAPHGDCILWSDTPLLDASIGGTASLTLHAGMYNAGKPYLLLGSISGTSPGTLLPGGLVKLPLNWDAFTRLVLDNLNSVFFVDFFGILDDSGMAQAAFNIPGPQACGYDGPVYFASALVGPPWDCVSNPVIIDIIN
jgi:nitrous oxidase accessory protein NosD